MGKSVAAPAASLANQVDGQRRAYVEFKKAFRRKHHDAMIKEMRSLDERVIRLQDRVSRALRSLVPLAWRILYLPLDHRTAAQIASREFDHLASTPGVMAIGVDSNAECLVVAVRRPFSNRSSPAARLRSRMPFCVNAEG